MKFVGAHVSIVGGIENAPLNAMKIGAKSFALFTKNQRRWTEKPFTEETIRRFKTNLEKSNIKPKHVLPHDSYLINLGSPDEVKLEKSRNSFIEELERCEQLGLKMLNFHIGSHMVKIPKREANREEKIREAEFRCLDTIVESLNIAMDATIDSDVKMVMENTAGQGTNLGYRFEHLAYIIENVKDKNRIGVCLDTCHTFTSGYDLRTREKYEQTMEKFDRVVGFEYLLGMHINDSKAKFASRVDRHHSLGDGEIGWQTFEFIMNDRRMDNIPLILETINPQIWDKEIIALYNLVK